MPKTKVEVVETTEESQKEDSEKKKQEAHKSTSWKRIGVGLGVVLIGNLYSYLTAYSKGFLFNSNTVIGLVAIIVGLYIILK